MEVASVNRMPALQKRVASDAPTLARANVARLARLFAEPASRKRTTSQVLPFDEACIAVAERARTFIDRHFREPIHLADICRSVGISVRTLQRCFKQCYGVTITSYLKSVRLDAACLDLIASNPSRETVTRIALRNGCSHLGRFSTEFRERFGQVPREVLKIQPLVFGQYRGGPQTSTLWIGSQFYPGQHAVDDEKQTSTD